MTPDEFVKRLHNHYGPPEHAADQAGLKSDYVASLSGSDETILAEASARIMKAHRYRVWPTIGECVQMVELVASERDRARQRNERPPVPQRREPTPQQKARIDALVKTATAKIRADEHAAVEARVKTASSALDWSRTTQPAWEDRMATSELARELSLPRELRGRK